MLYVPSVMYMYMVGACRFHYSERHNERDGMVSGNIIKQ